MKCDFLNMENSGRLIIIFAGWSTDAHFYRNLSLPGWDILIVHGYSDFDFPSDIIESYHTIALFAWSLGVYMASRVIDPERISLAIAINGTESPVNDASGIPVKIYRSTLATLNERNLMKFRRRMCAEFYNDIEDLFITEQPDIDNLKYQLKLIDDNSGKATGLHWNKVYISTRDMIFPPDAQKRAWSAHPSHPEIMVLDSPHYVDLSRIILSALPAKEKVGSNFHKALDTYDNQAIAQKAIARHLTDFPGGVLVKPLKVLELGPGSGIFSKMFAERFHPEEIDFVDLYPLPKFDIAPEEKYYITDAEDWVAHQAEIAPHSYDAVISASALQWFANPERFFKNVAALLRPGGFLLCSTFISGNLKELTSVNPYGLIYRSTDELEKMLNRHFTFSKLEEEKLVVDFPSPRQTLRHLKDTGVGGGLSTGRPLKEILETTPLFLTYRPLYIYAIQR